MSLRDLITQRAQVWEQYQEVLTRATTDGFSEEDREQLDRMEGEIQTLTRDIERLEQGERLSERFANTDPLPAGSDGGSGDSGRGAPPAADGEDRSDYDGAFWSFMRGGNEAIEGEARQVLRSGFVSGNELRAQGVATGAAGGYAVPQGFLNQVIDTMRDQYPFLDAIQTIRTDSGQSLEWPTADDTANKGAILAENTQVTEQDVTLGTDTLDAYMYTSKLVRVSLQLLNDAAFEFEGWLRSTLADRLAAIYNEHFTTGTGTSQPDGIITSATVGVTAATGGTTTITYDNIIDLEHSVREAYRRNGLFMFSDAALAGLRKVKDADGRPLWQPSLQAGVSDTFNGRRYIVNEDMADPAASAKSVAFGDFNKAYTARYVNGLQVLRLTERYADYLQVGFLAFQRADGTLTDAAAVRVFQQSAT